MFAPHLYSTETVYRKPYQIKLWSSGSSLGAHAGLPRGGRRQGCFGRAQVGLPRAGAGRVASGRAQAGLPLGGRRQGCFRRRAQAGLPLGEHR